MRFLPAVVSCSLVLALAGCSSPLQVLTVTSVTPTTLAAGASGTVLTVTGTRFTSGMSVLLGTTVLPTTFVSSTSLTATVPSSLPGGSYTVSVKDNGSTYVAAAVYASSLKVSITNPVPTVSVVSPTVFLSGQSSAAATVTGTGFVSGTTATVDGNARAVTVQDGTHLSVTLTADDLLFATTRALVIGNPTPGGGTAASSTITVTDYTKSATNYSAYGDSITYGYGVAYPALPYPYLLANAYSLTFSDHGATGDQACDTIPKRLYPAGDEYTTTKSRMYTYMIGTNETYYKGTGAYEAVYHTCHQAVLSWLALSRSNKIIAGDNGLIASGGCSSTPDTTRSGALYCATAGSIKATLQTYGSPIYLWYVVDDSAPAAATLQVTVDGNLTGSYATQLTPAIATLNGSTQSIALLRLSIPAGTHTVVAAAPSGSAGVLGVGTVPASRAALSFVVGADVPFQSSNPKASVATQVQYAADSRADIALLQSDGLDIRFAETRLYMLGTADEMSDALHPNALGHMHLQAAFQTGFTNLNSTTGPYAAAVTRPSSVALDTGTENVLPAVAIATVQPSRSSVTYRIGTSTSGMITVGNTSAHAQAATILAPAGESIDGAPGGYVLPAGEVVTLVRPAGTVGWTVLPSDGKGGRLTPALP